MPASTFITSCVDATAGSAQRFERKTARRPRAHQLLRKLAGKKNILVTTHEHPDPDALASCIGLCTLLGKLLPDARVTTSFKGRLGGGLNRVFAYYTTPHHVEWDESRINDFDAICLLDCQPSFTNSPLPPDVCPLAVIDHHPSIRGARCISPFTDIRRDIGASSSIVFGYYMEMDVTIMKDIAALMLYGIESDLAGAAGNPGDLDNVALSTLTLVADTRKLYRMRFVDLPQNYYVGYYNAMKNALVYNRALVSHLGQIESPEQPAVMADFLLRYDPIDWALVSGISGSGLVLSLRTAPGASPTAGSIMRKVVRHLGQGGGHPTKAGGYIALPDTRDETLERMQVKIRRRFLRSLGIVGVKPSRLIPGSRQC